jgi:hypothetical protein
MIRMGELSSAQLRGWPPGFTSGPGLTRYDQFAQRIDAATTVAEIRAVREEAIAWLLAAGGRNSEAVRHATLIVDRAERKAAEIGRQEQQ